MCPRAVGRVRVLFGSTEVEPVAEIDARDVLEETAEGTRAGRGHCVGRAHEALEVKLLRPTEGPIVLDGRGFAPLEVAPGEPGEIVVAGPHVQDRYLDDEAAMRALKIRGPDGRLWHRMGDVATRDALGRLWLLGRVGDAVPIGDREVYPLQVEPLVDALPEVRRAALVSVWGRPVLALEASGEAARVKARALPELLGVDVVIVPRIPVDPRHNAKIQRAALVKELMKRLGDVR
jgi:acyl-CoA synthetase (AMP-forming)/AMP-acid ligase II